VALVGSLKGIVDARHDKHQPGDGRYNTEEDQLTARVGSLRVIWVDCLIKVS
jgi:hypothetical protein